ncbi:SDR family oxidoreductase [uncultured Agrococcus sp.]|uniref:SDR family oxidoreductase n=1 Tax=uncultured Agrococcus sp. TaxID=382258 RepID=UPI0025D8BCA9|nr:SDR family oxidoreductase [uncultured Agrococcus sp.]
MTRTAIITGAGSGIGKATYELLKSRGYRVVGVDLRGSDIEGDLGTPQGRRQAAADALAAAGGSVDAVVAAAGISAPIAKTSAVNYFGVVEFLDALRDSLAESSSPRVAVISSFSSLQPNSPDLVDAMLAGDEERALQIGEAAAVQDETSGFVNYTSSKRAVARWVRRAAPSPEWAGEGIAINAVGPGVVVTPMTEELLKTAGEALDKQLPMPLNGHAKAETIAEVLAFLVSEANTHMTGQTLYIDGGAEALLRGDDIWSAYPPVGGDAPGDAPE